MICIRIFGCRSDRRARVRAESRRRAAADQHPARRRRRSANAGACTCRSRICARVRLHGGRPGGGRGDRTGARSCWRSSAARARDFYQRAIDGAAARGSPAARGRRDHAGGLLRDAGADRTERLRRVQRAGPRAAAATGADRIEAMAVAGGESATTSVVIGAGFAGLSAAVRLTRNGARVLVLEARARLGGRATAFPDRETGELVDNGQHVLLGCYTETFAFLRDIGAADRRPARAAARGDDDRSRGAGGRGWRAPRCRRRCICSPASSTGTRCRGAIACRCWGWRRRCGTRAGRCSPGSTREGRVARARRSRTG